MEKVPRYINVPQKVKEQRADYSLKSAVNDIKSAWTKCQGKSDCWNSNSVWSGEIDRPLAIFLKRLGQFFKTYEESRPTRGQGFTEFRQRMDPSPEVLPKTLETLAAKGWVSLHTRFTEISHHGSSPKNPEFQRYIEQLEQILIAVLIPQTVSDHEAIKREIAILEKQ